MKRENLERLREKGIISGIEFEETQRDLDPFDGRKRRHIRVCTDISDDLYLKILERTLCIKYLKYKNFYLVHFKEADTYMSFSINLFSGFLKTKGYKLTQNRLSEFTGKEWKELQEKFQKDSDLSQYCVLFNKEIKAFLPNIEGKKKPKMESLSYLHVRSLSEDLNGINITSYYLIEKI